MVSKELQAALDAAEAAAEIIRAHYGRGIGVRIKPDTSPVTEADVLAEQAIREVLACALSAYGFYGEETGQHDMDAEAIWIVDPIDGTKCFVREVPFFSTQIALWRAAGPCSASQAPRFTESSPGPRRAAALS
jgi:histidinol-phosphatase